jgi:hypothetical protein
VGFHFFSPIIPTPIWWINFQHSPPVMWLRLLIGGLFSFFCIILFIQLIKNDTQRLPRF